MLGQATRTPDEDTELQYYRQTFYVGFCIGGYLAHSRLPEAFQLSYDPTLAAPGQPGDLPLGTTKFWGCPGLLERLMFGIDLSLAQSIMQSGHWSGTTQDLLALVQPYQLIQPGALPIREAIDLVHASIYTTIKAMKFSHLERACGGPVEIAVITTDRPFRWVRHKGLDAAISQGGLSDA